MAKSLKFNLICKGVPVRSLEELHDNFSIEDIITYYNDQRLHRWLREHGYDSELEAVSAITGDEPMDIARELLRIFNVVSGEEADQYLQSYMMATAENIHCIQVGHTGKQLSKEAIELCESFGADVVDGTKFDILVTNDLNSDSRKMAIAKKRNNAIVLEDQLKEALEYAQVYYKSEHYRAKAYHNLPVPTAPKGESRPDDTPKDIVVSEKSKKTDLVDGSTSVGNAKTRRRRYTAFEEFANSDPLKGLKEVLGLDVNQ